MKYRALILILQHTLGNPVLRTCVVVDITSPELVTCYLVNSTCFPYKPG